MLLCWIETFTKLEFELLVLLDVLAVVSLPALEEGG